jgi:hypothetical protein
MIPGERRTSEHPKNNSGDDDHKMFMKISEDEYYLHDDRYIANQGQSPTVPKLSLKQLYAELGMDPRNPCAFSVTKATNGMCMIR